IVARVYLGEVVAREDGVAALREAEDADRVIDRVRLRATSGAQLERGETDGARAETPNDAVTSRRHRPAHRCPLEDGRVGVAALRADPALVRLERAPVLDRRL